MIEAVRLGAAIECDPAVCGGDPVLRGTRFPVHNLVSYLRLCGGDIDRLLADHPRLTRAQVDAGLTYYHDHAVEIDALIAATHDDYERGIAAKRTHAGT